MEKLQGAVLRYAQHSIDTLSEYITLNETLESKVKSELMYESEKSQRLKKFEQDYRTSAEVNKQQLAKTIFELKEKAVKDYKSNRVRPTADQIAQLTLLETVQPDKAEIVDLLKMFQDYPPAFDKVLEVAIKQQVMIPEVRTKQENTIKLLDTYSYFLDTFALDLNRNLDGFNQVKIQMIYDGMLNNINQYYQPYLDYTSYLDSMLEQ